LQIILKAHGTCHLNGELLFSFDIVGRYGERRFAKQPPRQPTPNLSNYRIIYDIFDHELVVDIIALGHRKDIYE